MTAPSIYKSEAGARAVMALYDSAIARSPVPVGSVEVPTRHGTTHVLTAGDQGLPPLVLLHGAGSSAVTWLYELAEYTSRFSVVAPDMPGEPGRSEARRLPWRGEAPTEWLADVITGLGLERPALVGMSLGGWVGTSYAVAHPSEVAALGLICPGTVCPVRPSFLLGAMLMPFMGSRGHRWMARRIFGNGDLPPEALEVIETIGTHYRHRPEAPAPIPARAFRRLTMPVMMVGGTDDAVLDCQEGARRLRALVPHTSIHLVQGGSHALLGTATRLLPFLVAATR